MPSYLSQVIAGHADAIDFIKEHRQKFNIKRLKTLPVSGAFHTKLMAPAKKEFEEQMNSMNISQPTIMNKNKNEIKKLKCGDKRCILQVQR